jgi:hypothetical protein
MPQTDPLHSCICSDHRQDVYKQVRKQEKPAHLCQEAFSGTQFLEVPRERHALPASLNVLWGNCDPEAVRIKEHSAPFCSEPAKPATCRDVGTLLFQRGHLESSQSWDNQITIFLLAITMGLEFSTRKETFCITTFYKVVPLSRAMECSRR